jgi:hypothetical protein
MFAGISFKAGVRASAGKNPLARDTAKLPLSVCAGEVDFASVLSDDIFFSWAAIDFKTHAMSSFVNCWYNAE